MTTPLSAKRIAALLTLGLAACAGDEAGDSLFIESCSLGCSSGRSGQQVFCSVVNTAVNQDFAVVFSAPVDPESISNFTFRVVNSSTGASPLGEAAVDPTNPRRVVFRPALTFDDAGNPNFGFEANASYQFLVPGTAQGGSSKYLKSTDGRENTSRLECTVLTDLGVIDPSEGAPNLISLSAEASLVGSSETTTIQLDDPQIEDYRVESFSPLVFRFDEPMNPATLFQPQTGTSSSVLLRLDEDGDLDTTDDRFPISGRFTVDVDLETNSTTLTFLHEIPNPDGSGFIPTDGFPSSGEDPDNPRRILLTLGNSITDIVGNKLVESPQGLSFEFIPEAIPLPPVILPGGDVIAEGEDPFQNAGREQFEDLGLYDIDRSGLMWSDGLLRPGLGGGSGRLGELTIAAGETLELSTDSAEVFPRGGAPSADLVFTQTELDAQAGGADAEIVVTDGIFEFSRLTITPGGTLRFVGTNPARLFVRGPVSIPGGTLIDLSGGNAPDHDSRHPDPMTDWVNQAGSNTLAPAVIPGVGGPGAGNGGFGAARYRFANGVESQGGANTTQLPTWVEGDTNGREGDPVPGQAATSGVGGSRFPSGAYPSGISWGQRGSIAVNEVTDVLGGTFGEPVCLVRQVGASGSGGGYALEGGMGMSQSINGTWEFPTPTGDNQGPATAGGDRIPDFEAGQAEEASFTNTGYAIRTLDPNQGFLNGGSGGGGGGSHPFATYYDGRNDFFASGCGDDVNSNLNSNFLGQGQNSWLDHSGASGGGGGGAIQICSGYSIELNGQIDVTGGDGGTNIATDIEDRQGAWAMPGGGGSGGAVLLQAPQIAISASPARIDVSGGQGGTGTINMLGVGGDGGPGLVRIEDGSDSAGADAGGADHDLYDQSIAPFDLGGSFGTFSVELLSVAPGSFERSDSIPDSYSAAMSCWFEPSGNFLNVNFGTDPDLTPDDDAPEDLSWNLHLVWDDGGAEPVLVPLRGDVSAQLATIASLDSTIMDILRRNQLNQDEPDSTLRSPLAVRFQGATSTSALADPCDGYAVPINAATLTSWVNNPDELNPGPGDPVPNVFRFAVFFDGSALGNADLTEIRDRLLGVTDLWIRADPD